MSCLQRESVVANGLQLARANVTSSEVAALCSAS